MYVHMNMLRAYSVCASMYMHVQIHLSTEVLIHSYEKKTISNGNLWLWAIDTSAAVHLKAQL